MSYDGPSMEGFELLQRIARAKTHGLTLHRTDQVVDSLANEHLIECRRSTNSTETWWITERGQQWIGGVAGKIAP